VQNSIKEKKDEVKRSHALNTNSDAPPSNNTQNQSGSILSFFIGILAAYLSWQCNTYENRGVGEKILWAFLAYIFSIPFFIYYLLIRSGQCSASKEKYKLSNPAAVDLTSVGGAGNKKSESGEIAKSGAAAGVGRSRFYKR
jgi:hypothetical protein